MEIVLILIISTFFSFEIYAQHKTKNSVIVAQNEFRRQEVSNGADSFLFKNEEYTQDQKRLVEKFRADQLDNGRKKLLPFPTVITR
jgi:hypothetical protein